MTQKTVTVERRWGAVLARKEHGDREHRYWFEPSDAGRLVFTSEVVDYKGDNHAEFAEGRHYRSEQQAEIPDDVADALAARGRGMIVSTTGSVLSSSR